MSEGGQVIDVAALLAAISEDALAGSDQREDFSAQSLYYRLRDVRSEARAAERQTDTGDATAAPAMPQWESVIRLSVEILGKHAKDLEVAAWCTEALLRCRGLPGLADGARLMGGLIETFWNDLHPMPDDEGLARRMAPVAGLNGEGVDGTLIQPLRKLVLFNRPDGEPFAFWQYQQSAELEGIADPARRKQRIAAGALPFETVETEARAATVRLGALRRAAADAALAWSDMARALDACAGRESPPTSRVRDLLVELQQVAERYAPREAAPTDSADPPRPAAESVSPQLHLATSGIASREEALRALDVIAGYFRRAEPHSPLAYTLQEAVRRGRLTWPELLEEIVPDAGRRAAILSSLGIRPETLPE